jgi:phosphoribosylformimino-5-aminoimidazole carboxamide ribotide isomerase
VRRFPAIAWQASGGVRDAADLHALAATGVACAISGRALVEDRIPIREIAPFLPAA